MSDQTPDSSLPEQPSDVPAAVPHTASLGDAQPESSVLPRFAEPVTLPATPRAEQVAPAWSSAPVAPPVAPVAQAAVQPVAPTTPVAQTSWVYAQPQQGYGSPVTQTPLVPQPKPVSLWRVGLIAGLVGGIISGLAGYQIALQPGSQSNTTISLPTASTDSSLRAKNSIAGLARAVLPTVVSISVSSSMASGTGSGFVVRSTPTMSYIVTNNHVASAGGASPTIRVQFQDQTELPATVVGTSPSYDLAVLQVSRGNLPTAQLGDSAKVVVGDLSIAIGSPLGLTGTVTSGIISALNRPVTTGSTSETSFINAIQTDAAINPGNSGGPLINAQGQVIGVNSAIATLGNSSFGGETGSIGLGFAIPINQARRITEEIISTGTSTHPVIGVMLDVNYQGEGARISSIDANGPAAKTDLKSGDVVTAIDGQKVKDGSELIVRIRSHVPGDTVVLTRNDGTTVKVTLGAKAN